MYTNHFIPSGKNLGTPLQHDQPPPHIVHCLIDEAIPSINQPTLHPILADSSQHQMNDHVDLMTFPACLANEEKDILRIPSLVDPSSSPSSPTSNNNQDIPNVSFTQPRHYPPSYLVSSVYDM